MTDSSTLPGGGPSHAIYDDAPPARSSSSAEQSISELVGEKVDFPALTEVISNIASAPMRGIRAIIGSTPTAEEVESKAKELADKLPQVEGKAKELAAKLPQVEVNAPDLKGKETTYKASDRPLDGEERTGAYILAAIVTLGFVLGGGSSSKGEGTTEKLKQAAKGAVGGVKGDANWEKNSGAGIVGHGARKA